MFIFDQFKVSMVFSVVGDVLGYKNGDWEFCYFGEVIYQEFQSFGGFENIDIKGWVVSDDIVLYFVIVEVFVSLWKIR